MIDPLDKSHFLSIDNIWAYIDTKIPSLEDLLRNLPATKEDTILNKRIAKGKEKDREKRFDRSKVQMKLICDGCNAQRCVYFNKRVGAKGGPTKYYVEDLQKWSEGGYMCGSRVPGDKFYVQRKLFCGKYIESQYYNNLGGKKAKSIRKGVRLITGNI